MIKYYFILAFMMWISLIFVNAQPIDSIGFKFDTLSKVATTPVKNQFKSGTCWSFATVSFIETELMRMGKGNVDISEMYFVYQAYLAKAQSFVRNHGTANFGPGGQAHDVMQSFKKYGFLYESEYSGYVPGFDNHVHGEMDAVLKAYLKSVIETPGGQLSQAWWPAYEAMLNVYMSNPAQLQEQALKNAKAINFNPDEYVEITSYQYLPYYEQVKLDIPDNWFAGLYYNLPIDELQKVAIHCLNQGYSLCWDGDVSNSGFSHAKALAIVPETKVENLSGTEQSKWENLSEAELKKNMYSFLSPVPERIINDSIRQMAFDDYSVTDDHLMLLTALLKDQNGTYYFVTKNSWDAKSNANGGYLNISEAYFRLNTVAIMLHKDAIPKDLKKKLNIK
jgi:bleomycin hydrolase